MYGNILYRIHPSSSIQGREKVILFPISPQIALIGVAIFVDGVHRISDLDAMTQIPGVRRTFKVFIASQESSPP
jgi:hypothetical protein